MPYVSGSLNALKALHEFREPVHEPVPAAVATAAVVFLVNFFECVSIGQLGGRRQEPVAARCAFVRLVHGISFRVRSSHCAPL